MSGHASSAWRDWPFKAADTIAVGDQHSGAVGIAYSTDPELLRQCVASGQVEGDQIVQHGLPELQHEPAIAEAETLDEDAPSKPPKPVRCAGGRTQHTMELCWTGRTTYHMQCRWCGKKEAV